MALTEITSTAINQAKIASIEGDTMTGTADENKAKFDELPLLATSKINDVINQLTGSNSSGTATNIDIDGDFNADGDVTVGSSLLVSGTADITGTLNVQQIDATSMALGGDVCSAYTAAEKDKLEKFTLQSGLSSIEFGNEGITTTLWAIPAPSYFFGGSINTNVAASSGLSTYTTLPVTKGPVSTGDWTVSSNRASSTVSGIYKVEGYVSFAPGSSSTTTSIAARLHIGSDVVVSRNESVAGALVTTHIGPVIINIAAGTNVYWDISATVAGETKIATNLSTLTIVRVG